METRPRVSTFVSSFVNYSNTIPAATDPDAKPPPPSARMGKWSHQDNQFPTNGPRIENLLKITCNIQMCAEIVHMKFLKDRQTITKQKRYSKFSLFSQLHHFEFSSKKHVRFRFFYCFQAL